MRLNRALHKLINLCRHAMVLARKRKRMIPQASMDTLDTFTAATVQVHVHQFATRRDASTLEFVHRCGHEWDAAYQDD
jgi:hypothetical protein